MGYGYSYVFVRTDIPLADQIVQVGHACLEAGNKFGKSGYLIVLQVRSQDRLLEALEHVEQHDIKSVLFYEPDDEMGYTAFCTQTVVGEQRKYFKKYKLWK